MYGGPDFLKSQLNWATRPARPGSGFKPFALAAALKDGTSVWDIFQGDSPIEIQGQELAEQGHPRNRRIPRQELLDARTVAAAPPRLEGVAGPHDLLEFHHGRIAIGRRPGSPHHPCSHFRRINFSLFATVLRAQPSRVAISSFV